MIHPTDFLRDLQRALPGLLPEMVLLGGIVLGVLLDVVRGTGHGEAARYRGAATGLAALALLVAGAVLWQQPNAAPFFERMLLTDAPARSGGLLVLFSALVALALLRNEENGMRNAGPNASVGIPHSAFVLALALGGVLLARVIHGIGLVLAIELLSIPSYALVLADRRDPRAAEAALKYILLGAGATGALLYGLSLLYGLTGSLHLADAAFWQHLRAAPVAVVALAWALVLAGLLFKLGGVPLHFWVPDAYEGAPLPVALLLSTAPKAAAAVALWRVADGCHRLLTPAQAGVIGLLLTGAAVLSLLIGTLGALNQPNVRRLLGYSSIAQAGFLLLAIRGAEAGGVGVVLLYAALLVLANGAVFGGVASFELRVSSQERSALAPRPSQLETAYAGLGRRFPVPAVVLTLGLVALTGLPPTLGFSAKLLAFVSLWEADASVAGRGLLVVGLLVTVGSLFFYLRLPYWLFLKEPTGPAEGPVPPESGSNGLWLAGLLAALLVAAFVKADWLLAVLGR